MNPLIEAEMQKLKAQGIHVEILEGVAGFACPTPADLNAVRDAEDRLLCQGVHFDTGINVAPQEGIMRDWFLDLDDTRPRGDGAPSGA